MATKLIRLDDDIFVEVEVTGDRVEQVAGSGVQEPPSATPQDGQIEIK